MAADNSNNLVALLQTLPQELWNKIYDDVFIADDGPRHITHAYKPPTELQVSKSTRDLFARTYYGNEAHFEIDEGLLVGWATALPQDHFLMIQSFNVPCSCRKHKEPCGDLHLEELESLSRVVAALALPYLFKWPTIEFRPYTTKVFAEFRGVERMAWTLAKRDGILELQMLSITDN